MAMCHEMKPDETYVCANCGLELKVMRSCDAGEDYDGGPGTCSCTEPVTCCGQPLTLKAKLTASPSA
jgi:hypothetical protein